MSRRVFLGRAAAAVAGVMGARLLGPAEALAAAMAPGEAPVASVAGIYPSLAMFNDEAECGTGAVVVWAGRLWAITYGPHLVRGSSDKLYEITPDLEQIVRPESVGGTNANRMIHAESQQLFIGPYVIDADGAVRVIPRDAMPGRLTGTARHISDPANKVHFATMEEGLYSVDVHTLEVVGHIKDGNGGVTNPTNPAPISSSLPGYHGKGLHSAPGLLVYSNNGEVGSAAETDPRTTSGALAEWDGEGDWSLVRRNQFTEVSGPEGIYGGNTDPDAPLWSVGWDHRSLLLMVHHGDEWTSYRLPKASHAYDGAHGWNTEWPRIRDIGEDDLLMTMHGAMWRFPSTFRPGQARGIAQRSTYLRVVGDFARWGDHIVFGSDDSAQREFLNVRRHKGDIAGPGQSQSNLWFVDPERLDHLGVPLGRGSVWHDEPLAVGDTSDAFLFAGFERRMLHLAHTADGPAAFAVEIDRDGGGSWEALDEVTVPGGGYRPIGFGQDVPGEWVRLRLLGVEAGEGEDLAARSDEFDGEDLDTDKWTVRVDADGYEVTVADGKLVIPALDEIDGAKTGPLAMVSQQLPEGDFTFTTRVTPQFERSWTQAGIMIWQSDGNQVKFAFGRDESSGGRRMVLASTSPPDDARQIGPMVPVDASFPDTAWLRLHREGDVVRAEFAPDLDGEPGEWKPFGGTRTLDTVPPRSGDGVQIGLYAGSDLSGPPFSQTAAFDFARFEAGSSLRVTAAFTMSDADERPDAPAPIFGGLARVGDTAVTGGLVRARGANLRTLGFVADRPAAGGGTQEVGFYELDGDLNLVRVDDPAAAQWQRDNVAIPTDVLDVDAASVLVIDDAGRRWRLPKSDPAFDTSGPLGIERLAREVSTERDLFNCHGTAYELPAENAGGFAKIRPVATHGLRIKDYCSYRGMLVLSGVTDDAEGERIVRSDDGQVALWVGAIDDLWQAGRPRGWGGPWAGTPVAAGAPSDPYLMTGYEGKVLTLSHDAAQPVAIAVEVDVTGDGTWAPYETFTVPTGQEVTHRFPDDFAAYWVRCVAAADCVATAQLVYGEREDSGEPEPAGLELGEVRGDSRNGSATIDAHVTRRGSLEVRGTGVRPAVRPRVEPGTATLPIAALGVARRALARDGSVELDVAIVFRPEGGEPVTATRTVELVKDVGGGGRERPRAGGR